MSTSLFPVPSLSPFDGSLGLSAFLGDLSAMWNYCMANDVFVSRSLESQVVARDLLDELLIACNCAPVFSEGQLKIIPYSEVSCVGNGVVFNAPTSAGPLFDFDERHFIVTPGANEPPIKVTRPRLSDVSNIASVEYINRDGEYNTAVATAVDTALVAQYGPMRAEPKRLEWIHDHALAQKVALLLLRNGTPDKPGTLPRRKFSFRLPPHFGQLEPMDLVTVSNLAQRLWRKPVRLTSVKENDKMELECEAEEFIYGSHAIVTPLIVSASGGTPITTNALPGAVNAPIIFEAIPALHPTTPEVVELWLAVSGADPNYGGAHVWMSTDGGASYSLKGTIVGSATMGYLTAGFPSHPDPDTSDTLAVNLAPSKGTLGNFTQAQEDLFLSLLYLEGGGPAVIGGQPAFVPYELSAYESATLTGANQWSMGTRLRRGVYGSPIAGHNSGAKFAFLGDPKVLKLQLPLNLVGQVVYFKFTAFNTFGSQEQNLSFAVPYSYLITGFAPLQLEDSQTMGQMPPKKKAKRWLQ